jgi:hypothetical protein
MDVRSDLLFPLAVKPRLPGLLLAAEAGENGNGGSNKEFPNPGSGLKAAGRASDNGYSGAAKGIQFVSRQRFLQ